MSPERISNLIDLSTAEKDNFTQLSSHLSYDTPRKKQIRKEANMKIEKYKRKIKILQQKERRHKEKIKNLEDLLKSLKKKILFTRT